MASGLDENVFDRRADRYFRNHIAGVCPFVTLYADTTLAQELNSNLIPCGRQREIVVIKFEALETNIMIYAGILSVREVLSIPEHNIVRDMRKAS